MITQEDIDKADRQREGLMRKAIECDVDDMPRYRNLACGFTQRVINLSRAFNSQQVIADEDNTS